MDVSGPMNDAPWGYTIDAPGTYNVCLQGDLIGADGCEVSNCNEIVVFDELEMSTHRRSGSMCQ